MGLRFLIVLGLLALPLFAARIAIIPFVNNSSYKGNWTLEKDLPAYFEKDLAVTYSTIPSDTLFSYIKKNGLTFNLTTEQKRTLARKFSADIVISADITRFSAFKRIMGEGRFGGLKSYGADISLSVKIYNERRGAVILEETLSAEKKENNTAINIGRISQDEELYDSLRTEPFGSRTFDRTIVGTVMKELSGKMRSLIEKSPEPVARKGEERKLIRMAKVVDITETDVYLNAGQDDQVLSGDRFNVFAPGDSIKDPETGAFIGESENFKGTLEVMEVKASHFSRARIILQKDSIRRLDKVRIEK